MRLFLAGILACAGLGFPSVASAALEIRDGKIAYTGGTVAPEVFLRNLDGSGVTQLTDDPNGALLPVFSPDGRQIAYARGQNVGTPAFDVNLFVMNVDGSDPRPLTADPAGWDSAGAYSLDGTRITFDRAYPQQKLIQVWVMNADGSDPHRVTKSVGQNEYSPDFSPDDRHIAFAAAPQGSPTGIFVAGLDDGSLVQLTNGSGGDTALADESPAYSPDGSRIAFRRGCEIQSPEPRCRIYLMKADGSNLRPLSDPALYVRDLAWSPEGDQILFEATDRMWVPFNPPEPRLYVVDVDGSDPRVLARSDNSRAPVWQRRVIREGAMCRHGVHLVAGAAGPNILRGMSTRDAIDGQQGNDVLLGLAGADELCGGAGSDRLLGGPGRDRLLGGRGSDVLKGGSGRDVLLGGPGRDKIVAGPGDLVR